MKILALDIATQMGVAVGNAGGDPVAWSVDLGERRSHEARFSKILHVVAKLMREHNPDFVAIEAPIKGKFKSDYLIGLAACARGVVANRGAGCEVYDISSIRKAFCGRRLVKKDFYGSNDSQRTKALKAEVMRHCKIRGWDVSDHDAADACAVWEYACARHKVRTFTGELFA